MKNGEDFFGLTKIVHPSSDVLFSKNLLHPNTLYMQFPKEKRRKKSVQENEGVSRESSKGRGCFHTNFSIPIISLL